MPAAEFLCDKDILSPPLIETMATKVIANPNNTIGAKRHLILNVITY